MEQIVIRRLPPGTREDYRAVAKANGRSLEAELRDLIDAGHVRPVIDSEHPLDRAGEAVALVRDGRPAGKVVVTMAA